MNKDKTIFAQLLAHPDQADPVLVAGLLEKYPYLQALRILNGDAAKQPGLYTHWLWEESYLQPAVLSPETGLVELPEAGTVELPEAETETARVSVYNDEHLPYTFLWWLNKTRMDFAHTYKPYASTPASGLSKTGKFEEELLDQQIRENIFHLQEPEQKMSENLQLPAIPFQVPKKSDPVIDRFIQEEPKISPPKPDKLNLENKARKSASDDGSVVTETLAKIYEEQGLYPKALEVYEKLSLKFPEKSGYFADRIEELKNKLI